MTHVCKSAIAFGCLLCVASPHTGAYAGEITLSEAYSRVEASSPDLAASAAARSAAGEGVRQARARPNPELEIEMEKFGSGPIEIMVTQDLSIGGVRGAGIRHALAVRDVAQYELEAAHIHQRAETMRRFASVMAARQKVEVADSLVALAQATMASIRHRVESGSAMPVDSIRAEMELREINLRRAEAVRDYGQARRHLATLWGDPSPPAWEPAGDFECAPFPLPVDQVLRSVETHPAMKAMAAEVQAAVEERAKAEAEAFPGLSLGVGVLHEPDQGTYAALIRTSIPLPVMNRNRAGVAQAYHGIEHAQQRLAAALLARQNEATAIMDQIVARNARIEESRQSLIPRSELILEEMTAHYQRGSISIIEVIDAQRSLMELLRDHAETLAERAHLAADLMELTGIECPILR